MDTAKLQWLRVWGTILLLTGSLDALATPHALINATRGADTNVFVSQGIEGEYGTFNRIGAGEDIGSGNEQIWRGYSFRNSLGLELMKFVQFSVSHAFVNMRSKANSLENIRGSRIMGETRLVFSSPIGNVEAGGGVLGSKMEYQMKLLNSDFLGSGYFYSLGLNYFFSQRVSLYGQGRVFNENLVRNGGSSEIENIKSKTSNIGLGFSIWL
ncbi:MAG: hypothetical protein AB7T49_08290 [Oligoflexales bacterium]